MDTAKVEILFSDGERFKREWLESHPERANEILRRYKGSYPLCLCQQDGIPLHIRELTSTGTLYLARMPNTGIAHAAFCPSYEPSHGEGEKRAVEGRAIEYLPDGRIVFNLDSSLDPRGSTQTPHELDPGKLPQGAKLHKSRLGLIALLQVLWEQSELHHWRPGMLGRRRYRQVYNLLMAASHNVIVKGRPLYERLFIPEPFIAENSENISYDRQERVAQLSRGSDGKPRRFFVSGRVRDVVLGADVVEVHLAHLPGTAAVSVPRKVWRSLTRRWRLEETICSEDESVLWGIFVVDRITDGRFRANEAALQLLTEHFIPVYRTQEIAITYALVDSGRSFVKLLPFDVNPDSGHAAFHLTDTGHTPVKLFLVNGDTPVDGAEGEWYWNFERDECWPALPRPRALRAL